MHEINDKDLDEMVVATKAHRDGEDQTLLEYDYKGVDFHGEVFTLDGCETVNKDRLKEEGYTPLAWPLLGVAVGMYLDEYRPLTEEERDVLRGSTITIQ